MGPSEWAMIRRPPSSTAIIKCIEVKNVFITDGSCMTSSGTANPSLTYMALTARACDFAFTELRKKFMTADHTTLGGLGLF